MIEKKKAYIDIVGVDVARSSSMGIFEENTGVVIYKIENVCQALKTRRRHHRQTSVFECALKKALAIFQSTRLPGISTNPGCKEDPAMAQRLRVQLQAKIDT